MHDYSYISISALVLQYILIIVFFHGSSYIVISADYLDSPVMPRIPNCNAYNKSLSLEKKSQKKIFLCAMFKDEEGYLAEFVAYYKIHGFDHIILWNGNSKDDYITELAPWVNTGFVEVREVSSLRDRPHVQAAKHFKDPYFKVIAMQKEVERQCISWGIRNKYDYYLTADMDEYVVPFSNRGIESDHRAISIVDVLDDIFLETNDRLAQTVFLNKEELSRNGIHYQRNNSIHDIKSQQPPPPTIRQVALAMIKYNFASVPHVLEPVDLLMIESYLTRYDAIGYMNYYMSTQPKFVYRLSGPDIASIRQDGLEETYKDSYKDKMTDDYEKLAANPHKNPVCGGRSANWMAESPLRSRDLKRKPKPKFWLRLNHYSRTVEKFTIKQLSWTETVNAVSNNAYLHRGYSGTYDPVALVYSCLVRAEINKAKYAHQQYSSSTRINSADSSSSSSSSSSIRTPTQPSFEFLRRGKYWSRNPEYGRERHYHMEGDITNFTSHGINIMDTLPLNPTSYINIAASADNGEKYKNIASGSRKNTALFIDYYGL